jgi:hypothetical protein
MVVESVAQEVGAVESAGCGSWASNLEYGRRPSSRRLHTPGRVVETPGRVVESVVQEVGAVESAGCGR